MKEKKIRSKKALLKSNKAITLIALVVTIVILLILAAVSINIVFKEDGLIKKAKQATTEYKEGEKKDLNSIENLSEKINEMVVNKITP